MNDTPLISALSPKQMKVMSWWLPSSPEHGKTAIICDGAVRSGKTLCMSLSFALWALAAFDGTDFAICGKTITGVRRNLAVPLITLLRSLGFGVKERISQNHFDVSAFGHRNRFYLFGGRDESSASLIQGITLGGVLLDEVALMPRSFTEQALARCSLGGSRFWFNCNPEHPGHWFHREWIEKADEKNALYLHFIMEDNPSLGREIIARYKALYSGAFYERFVEGRWVAASGCVYPMFSEERHIEVPPPSVRGTYISCDYGTVNPSSFGLWGQEGGKWYRLAEYYYDSRQRGAQRTDEEHYAALEELAGDNPVEAVIVDPSAASFIECIARHGRFRVIRAKNDVLDGIRRVSDALREGKIVFAPCCKDSVREFGLYRWNESGITDSVKKENDHAMDDIRYFVSTALCGGDGGFFALAVDRKEKR